MQEDYNGNDDEDDDEDDEEGNTNIKFIENYDLNEEEGSSDQ